jgi:hypothetical protein
MSSVAIRLLILACIFGAGLFGMFLRTRLPEQHLSVDSKDTVRIGIGMIATMAALVLGLLVASAKNFYDAQSSELTQMSANVVVLDRLLAQYGPETKEARDLMRAAVARTLDLLWHQDQVDPAAAGGGILYEKIQALSPKNDAQRTLQAQALSMAFTLANERWLMIEEQTNSISLPLLAMLVFWLVIVFAGFGLFSPTNMTVVATLFLCAVAVSGAIFLIVEMYTPFKGLMQLSSAPLRNALGHLGQ